MKNLDPKSLSVPRSGWAAEDRARELLDLFNGVNDSTDWSYSQLVTREFPSSGTHDFTEGFILACTWLAGGITGGRLRNAVTSRDQDRSDFNTIMFQRLIEHAEHIREEQQQ